MVQNLDPQHDWNETYSGVQCYISLTGLCIFAHLSVSVGRLLYLDNGKIITLCFSDVGYIILELKAWQIIVDVLQD